MTKPAWFGRTLSTLKTLFWPDLDDLVAIAVVTAIYVLVTVGLR
jgi:hypothetical protein